MAWFKVIATKKVDSDTMKFDAECRIDVLANSPSEAMRKARLEFRNWHLEVEQPLRRRTYSYLNMGRDGMSNHDFRDMVSPDEGDRQ